MRDETIAELSSPLCEERHEKSLSQTLKSTVAHTKSKTRRRFCLLSVIVVISPFLAAWVALFLGAYGVTPLKVLSILANALSGIDSPEAAIVLDIRLPRIILAGLVGMSLATSGATMQAVLRNPLVDPFILGISAGAAFGCAITIGFLPMIPLQLMSFVFGGL
ncbi:MAG: iron chelate uptake ABC transporter family permease subunit, partial [Pseudomonadota bacterium]